MELEIGNPQISLTQLQKREIVKAFNSANMDFEIKSINQMILKINKPFAISHYIITQCWSSIGCDILKKVNCLKILIGSTYQVANQDRILAGQQFISNQINSIMLSLINSQQKESIGYLEAIIKLKIYQLKKIIDHHSKQRNNRLLVQSFILSIFNSQIMEQSSLETIMYFIALVIHISTQFQFFMQETNFINQFKSMIQQKIAILEMFSAKTNEFICFTCHYYLKAFKDLPAFQYNKRLFIQNQPLLGKLLIIRHLSIDKYFNLIEGELAKSEPEFEILNEIVKQYFNRDEHLNLQSEVAQFWFNNCLNLLQILSEECSLIQLTSYLNELNERFIIRIYWIIDFYHHSNTQAQSEIITIIWNSLLKHQSFVGILEKDQQILINLQLYLHKKIRQILLLLDKKVTKSEERLILEIYKLYYCFIFKQTQLMELKQAASAYLIDHHSDLITVQMLVRQDLPTSLVRCKRNTISKIKIQLIDRILIRYSKRQNWLLDLIYEVQSPIVTIILKYLIDQSRISFDVIVSIDQLFDYTIENNLELHLDKYESLIQQKVSLGIQKYLEMLSVSKNKRRNRYQHIINCQIVQQLMNGTDQGNINSKYLPVSFQVLMYLCLNFDDLKAITEFNERSLENFIKAIHFYLLRCLYHNIEELIFLMLLLLTNSGYYQYSTSQVEVKLIAQLLKFAKSFTDQLQRIFLAFSSICLLVFGCPASKRHEQQATNRCNTFLSDNYFLQKNLQLLSRMELINHKLFQAMRQNNTQEARSQKLLICCKKIYGFGIVRYQKYISNFQLQPKLNQLIYYFFFVDVISCKATHFDQFSQITQFFKKRSLCLEDKQHQLRQQEDQSQGTVIEIEQNHKQKIDQLLDLYLGYDQFKDYNEVRDGKVRGKNYSRVHGRVREIRVIRR